jgi:hypothetical protein
MRKYVLALILLMAATSAASAQVLDPLTEPISEAKIWIPTVLAGLILLVGLTAAWFIFLRNVMAGAVVAAVVIGGAFLVGNWDTIAGAAGIS